MRLIVFFILITTYLYAAEEKLKNSEVKSTVPIDEKVYSEKDFIEKVQEELKKRVLDIKKKSVSKLTQELIDKEAELKKREYDIERNEELTRLSRNDFEKKIQELEAKQKKIIGCIDDNEKRKADRIRQLVKVISGMKPDKAAELLSVQDDEISVKLISDLAPDKASKIFNLMSKETSARLQKQYLNMKR